MPIKQTAVYLELWRIWMARAGLTPRESMTLKITKELFAKDKLYGTATVGSKGQIVIPAQARKELNIKPGDRLMIVSKFGKVLGLVKAQKLSEFLNTLVGFASGEAEKQMLREYMTKIFGPNLEAKSKKNNSK